MIWFKENDIRINYTKQITPDSIPADSVLKLLPGIFQQRIQKAYELRITYFGDYPVTVKLMSQEHPKGQLDWRYVPSHELIIEEYKLPEKIDQKCKEFMKKFGIVFGCFDFIVTPDQEHYFLEVNESGQFLWIEALNPNIPMLDIFTEFLINQKPVFHWKRKANSLVLSKFEQRVRRLSKENSQSHVSVNLYQEVI